MIFLLHWAFINFFSSILAQFANFTPPLHLLCILCSCGWQVFSGNCCQLCTGRWLWMELDWFCTIDSSVQQQAPVLLLHRCHQSCHLPAQKRPPLLNRSGDKMDYRSFIRALKFQNRTRPSAAGLLWCWSYQNSFWRDVLDHQLGSYEDWGPMLFFWLSSNTQLMMQSRQRPNIDKGHGVDLRQSILLLPRTQARPADRCHEETTLRKS